MEEAKINDVVYRCLEKWGKDSRTETLYDDTIKWLNNVDERDKEIYLRLLYNFQYYSKKSENRYAEFVLKKVKEIDISINETIFIPLLKKEEGISGAHKLLRAIQVVGGLNSILFPQNLIVFENLYDLEVIKNIIVVDDISGSGKTLNDNLNYMKELYPNYFIRKKVYVTCLSTSEIAYKKIRKLMKSENISYWRYHITKKAFDGKYIFSQERCGDIKQRIKRYEKKLSTSNYSDIFGFKQGELLVAFSDNTPNNTLLSFWKKKGAWDPIFPRARTSTRPSWANKSRKNIKSNIIEQIHSKQF